MEKNDNLFYDITNKNIKVSLIKAITEGVNPETGGSYMPVTIPPIEASMKYRNPPPSFRDLVLENAEKFCVGVPYKDLMSVIAQFFPYTIPVTPIDPTTYVLELFNGESHSFKDISMGFLVYLLDLFADYTGRHFNVIIAATGEDCCALGRAVERVNRVKALILFPEGTLTELQKKQISNFSERAAFFSVNGNMRDCKQMVKQALSDKDLRNKIPLTAGGNSNFAVILPKIAYYIYGCLNARHRCAYYNRLENPQVIAAEASRDFGNLIAGLIAKKRGAPIKGFIKAAMSDTENEVLNSGFSESVFAPAPENTASGPKTAEYNGRNISFPHNKDFYGFTLEDFLGDKVRNLLENIYTPEELHNNLALYSTTAAEAVNAMSVCKEKTGYIIDPIGASAWQSWQEVFSLNLNNGNIHAGKDLNTSGFFGTSAVEQWTKNRTEQNLIGLVLQTSHSAHFHHLLPRILSRHISLPQEFYNFESSGRNKYIEIEAGYANLKTWLLSNYN